MQFPCLLLTLLASLLLLVLGAQNTAAASYTPLGCFQTSKVRLVAAPSSVKATPTPCSNYCRSRKLPIFGIMCAKRCVCSGELPVTGARVPAAKQPSCSKPMTSGCNTVNLAYMSAVGNCRYSTLPLTSGHLSVPVGADRTTFENHGDKLTLKLYSTMGARVENNVYHTYGLHTIRAQPAAQNGIVSAFYLTSSSEGAPTGSWDEIDCEFINFRNFKDTPGLLWTNIFRDGKSVRENEIPSSTLAGIIGSPGFRTIDAMATYTLDWQPGYIRWYINGKLVDERTYSIPNKAMHMVFTIWGRNDWNKDCLWWGGCVDNGQSGAAVFRSARRVICK